jgi:hypothetical protein
VGDTINSVVLTFSTPDITNLHVKIGFNGNATTDCTVDSSTQATCSGLTEDLAGATALAVAVTGTP